jgi:hypothetical protein
MLALLTTSNCPYSSGSLDRTQAILTVTAALVPLCLLKDLSALAPVAKLGVAAASFRWDEPLDLEACTHTSGLLLLLLLLATPEMCPPPFFSTVPARLLWCSASRPARAQRPKASS